MKRKTLKYILWVTVLLFGVGLYSLNADFLAYTATLPEIELLNEAPQDTVPKVKPRFPVAKTIPEEYQDIVRESPADLKTPENVKTVVEYDLKSGSYVVRTRLGDADLMTPISLTPEEYQDYSFQKSLQSYYRQKNAEEFQKEANKKFNLADMQFNIGAAERIFGPGGVRVKTQGSAEVTLGLKQNKTKNPSLPVRARNRTFFNFDESVQLNVQASVGSKVDFNMNYNTETSFDFDSKKLKLAYTGEEDEIIKSLEAGNVSMATSNSLINGGAALFGMKADLQFGKLRVNTLFAQQESESKTVSSKGGVQTKPYELTIDQYDENRHFFLAQYFRDKFDAAVANLPSISSGVKISRVEVWVTNKRGSYDQARNIVAFSDLAEHTHISNPGFVDSIPAAADLPYNGTNNLYTQMNTQYTGARDISKVNQAIGGVLSNGIDYEKVESARLLDPTEYTLNAQLGYISLKTQLQADEVLGVAYNYTYSDGVTYQVGEFSTDNPSSTAACLYVKLLKGTSMSPNMPFWDLMMKNVYSLGAYSVQKEKFKMEILYQSDTTGTYINYLPEGNKTILLRLLNLDNLDANNERHPDGIFDFIDGSTILSENGKVIFPCVEPFGSYLRNKINNNAIADKFVFQELYDSTLTVARQIAEKNKFLLRGEYKASSGAEIQLGASNVARGSVKVTAGGAILTENVDYSVDYTSGVVTILNESIISSGTPVSVSLENQSAMNMQRKTMMGLDLNYHFTPNFLVGATVMHMSEMPLTTKTVFGDEAIKNTLWGVNMSYKGESQWLTNMFDKLPLLNLTKPSQIAFNAEFAHLIAGHYESKTSGGYSYLDDFESTQSNIDLLDPYPWQLSSVPFDDNIRPLFPEANLVNDINYGKNRALLAWYTIDGLFTRRNSSLRPDYMDNKAISDHYVRAVQSTELFPERYTTVSESNTLRVLNLAYYPTERGPYNLDADNIDSDGLLLNPEKRFGGMMRKIDQTDFEAANVEYIEFWMLDPFIYNRQASGGDLYFNLGEISEDILKDEKKFFENGLPIDGDTAKIENTVWGKVPKQQSTVYAFDNSAGARELQDVGLNGLSSTEEQEYPAYKEYLDKLRQRLNPQKLDSMMNDPLQLSPFFDPAGDKFHYFRGTDYDREELDILTRYKRFNGTEGNSKEINQSAERYSTSSKTVPDVEDLNQDNTLNENEKYFEYKISVRPQDTIVGTNYIADKRTTSVSLADGTSDVVTWYQFKIPVKQYGRRVGTINDFKTIRFMRMYMTGFKDPAILRFGTLQLVRGEWRSYEQDLSDPKMPPAVKGTLEVSTVNIEENSDRDPVNYILPPDVSRVLDPSQPQVRPENEQSLSLKVMNLAGQDARAIYKNTNYDLRQYKRLQLFTHAEALKMDVTNLQSGDVSVFIRLGSDYKNNYYEYEVPLTLTPHGRYGRGDGESVWPTSNKLDFRLESLTDAKLERNRLKRSGEEGISFQTVFSTPDKDSDPIYQQKTISVKGNPSLSEIKTIMIGVRNKGKEIKSVEVWVNELRLTDFNEEGGWAANANLNVALSDLGTVNVGGRIETAGFGALDQSLNERRMEDFKQYNVATSVELGKLLPEKAQVSIPFYYAYSKETYDPKYNPLDQDVKLKDAINTAETKTEKDSIRQMAQDRTVIKSVSFNNVRVNIKSKTPMPYDPANFTLGYSYSVNDKKNPDTEYETMKDYRGNFAYSYVPYVKPFKPFDKMLKQNNGYTRYAKQLALNPAPSINFQTALLRNYYEVKLRDLTGAVTGVENDLPVTFSQNFYWDRAFNLNWALTNNLNINFSSGTNARIEEPYMQVNKQLNPEGYDVWRDSVKQSIADLGTPMKYDQQLMVTWQLPLQMIPVLDWMNVSATYNATYNWDRGATVVDSLELGNTIRNQRQFQVQGNFNLLSLYNKNKYLKKINTKFSTTSRNTNAKPEKKIRPKLEKEITLNLDSGTVVEHGMFTKKLQIKARGADGRLYSIKFKPINFAQVMILNKDTAHLKLTIYPGPAPTEDFLYKAVEHSARFLMMVRRFNISFTNSAGMILPGFNQEIGDIFGQGRTPFGYSPGLGFAFGSVSRSYIEQASERNWLVGNNTVNPAVMTSTNNLNVNATLEPIAGLKIDLNALRNDNRNREIQYMYNGMPEVVGGNFTMTTIALGSALSGSGNQANNYASKTFDKFIAHREVVAQRLEGMYGSMTYPKAGFIDQMGWGGRPYTPGENNVNGVNRNSSDVLIPAFIAAYTGKNPNKVGLSPFPSILSMLPNWTVTYDGLTKIPTVKKYFKNVTLRHKYTCTYTVGAFTSFLNWVDAGQDGLGYIRSILNDNPTPSSPYSISSVSLMDAFNPLLGVDATMINNVTVGAKYSTSRNMNLNTTSYQLVESLSKTFTVSLGYKMAEFNKVLKMKKTRDFSNDLTVRLDFSMTKMQALIRKIEDSFTQATSGNIAKTIQFSADYGLSRALTLRAFYDIQINEPLISSASYPTSNSNYGISLRFSLAQ